MDRICIPNPHPAKRHGCTADGCDREHRDNEPTVAKNKRNFGVDVPS